MATLGLSSQAPAVPGASVDGDIAAMVKDVSATPTATVVHDFPGTGPRVITILMSAAIHGLCEAIVPLVGAGAELDATDEFGWTALMHAAASGHLEVVTALLACKPDLQIKSTVDAGPCAREGWDALAIALRARQCEIATLLIEATANVRVNYREEGRVLSARRLAMEIADNAPGRAALMSRLFKAERANRRRDTSWLGTPMGSGGSRASTGNPAVMATHTNNKLETQGHSTFNSLDENNKRRVAFSDSAPVGRFIKGPGAQVEAKCVNVEGKCEAALQGHNVIIHIGMREVRPFEEEFTETMACPVCHSTKAKIHTMGFYQCKYDWWGRVAREDATDHGRVSGKGRAADGKYHLFTGTKVSGTGSKAKVTGETSEYRVLVVRATPLS